MKFYIVDAFTHTTFGGNPAGIVLLNQGQDFPPEATMLQTAAELRYSETAFVKTLSPNGFHTRYFTPTDEVDLCGHATIAAFSVLLAEGVLMPGSRVMNQTLAGELEIQLEEGRVMMEMATPQALGKIDTPEALAELFQVMGFFPEPVFATDRSGQKIQLFPMIISTGLPDILLPVSSPEKLENISPDYAALSSLAERYNVVGVHAFSLVDQSTGFTAYCRNFAPLYGIPEEAATGTSNGALTHYLALHGLMTSGEEARFLQGREMNRPSVIETRITKKDATPKIQVGGTGVILAKGDLFI